MNAKEIIIKTLELSSVPLKSSEIAEKSGVDKKMVDKVIRELKKEEKIEVPKRCCYQLKK